MKKLGTLSWDIKIIFKKQRKQLLGVGLLIGFLFYLSNIFFGVNQKINNINSLITDKVGIYFYIDNSDNTETYNRIINIKDQLAKKGIDSEFSSKNDAFNFLEKKIPEVTKNFEKYDINNPLPSTLYIMFENNKEYNFMKDIILKNKDIILNVKDIDKGATLQQQENRALRMLKLANIIKISTYLILAIIGIIIIFFIQHLIQNFFDEFYKELQTKKLLGATYKEINLGFITVLLSIISIGFLFGLIITFISFESINYNLNLLGIDGGLLKVIPKTFLLYIGFSIIAILLGYNKLYKLEKKI